MHLNRFRRAATLGLAVTGLIASATFAQEKNWSLDVGADYSTRYMFRGVPLLGDNEVITPHATFSIGSFNAYYYGYLGDVPADFTASGHTASYHEDDFGADFTIPFSDKFGLTLGAVSYMYSNEVTDEYGFEDTYELYAIAAWDVPFSPTISYYRDMDVVKGGYATFGVSRSYPLGTKASLDFSAAVGFDFGYNLGESVAAGTGLEKSNGDLNDVLVGINIPIQINDWLSVHAQVQESIALKVLDDLGVDDETIVTGGVGFTF
ncbi:MAG: hypothetical protein ABI639_09065 [Thermoanaerobaculia bacterium]